MAGNPKLSQAAEGLFYKTATGKSPHTIADYRTGFKKLLLYFDADPLIASITHDQLIAFLHGFRMNTSASRMVWLRASRFISRRNPSKTSRP